MQSYRQFNSRGQVESTEDWKGIIDKLPSLKFRKKYEVKIIPPFGGAVARFYIEKNGEHVCSVYCDFFDRLGGYGEPYYELYPFEDDIKRYSLNQTDEMMKDIHTIWMSVS